MAHYHANFSNNSIIQWEIKSQVYVMLCPKFDMLSNHTIKHTHTVCSTQFSLMRKDLTVQTNERYIVGNRSLNAGPQWRVMQQINFHQKKSSLHGSYCELIWHDRVTHGENLDLGTCTCSFELGIITFCKPICCGASGALSAAISPAVNSCNGVALASVDNWWLFQAS